MFVNTFKTDVIFLYINNVIKCLMSRWLIMFTIRVSWLILTISRGKNKDKKNDQITAKLVILELCFLILNIPPFWTETSNKSVRSGHDLLLSKSMWTYAFVILVFSFLGPYILLSLMSTKLFDEWLTLNHCTSFSGTHV